GKRRGVRELGLVRIDEFLEPRLHGALRCTRFGGLAVLLRLLVATSKLLTRGACLVERTLRNRLGRVLLEVGARELGIVDLQRLQRVRAAGENLCSQLLKLLRGAALLGKDLIELSFARGDAVGALFVLALGSTTFARLLSFLLCRLGGLDSLLG